MKICTKCGAQQSDKRAICVDCGNILGNALSESEMQLIKKQTEDKIETMYNKTDPLYVSIFDKIVGFASLLGIVITIVFMFIYRYNYDNDSPEIRCLIYALVLFVNCFLNALIPKILWSMERFRLSFITNNTDDAEPSYFYAIGKKFAIYGGFIVAIVLIIFVISKFPLPMIYIPFGR